MLADTVEAACKSLDNPTEARLEKFVDTLITSKMEHGQLDYCSLTFGDLKKIKSVFVKILAAYYHGRIKYPNQKDPDGQEKKEPVPEKTEKEIKSEKTAAKKTDATNGEEKING